MDLNRRRFVQLASSGLLIAAAEPVRRFWQVPRYGYGELPTATVTIDQILLDFERSMQALVQEAHDAIYPSDVKRMAQQLLEEHSAYLPKPVVEVGQPEPGSRTLPDVKFSVQLAGPPTYQIKGTILV